MKSNLDKAFKTDSSLEKNGVWFDVSETTSFLIKRFGGGNITALKAATTRHLKPYVRQIQNDTLPVEKALEINVKVFVESCVIDWRGVEIDGKEVPFDKEEAIKLFISLPELYKTLEAYANDIQSYKEDLGNS